MAGILRAIEAFVFNVTEPLSPEEEEKWERDEEPRQDQDQEDLRPVRTHKSTVLAIDDDLTFLHVLRPVLRGGGFNVLTSTSGAKGLDMLRYAARDIGVVLLDYNMPQLNGVETLQHIRRLTPEVKVLALTGVDAKLLPANFCEGVDKLLQKPFRNEDLIGSIDSLLRDEASTATGPG